MAFPVYNTQAYVDRLTALIAAQYPTGITAAKCNLYKNDVSPDANMTTDTFVVADYGGYAAVSVVMSSPSLNDQGLIVSKSTLINFPAAAGVTPTTIYGIYIVNDEGDTVIAAQRFDTPQVQGGALPTAISGIWRTSEPLTNYGWIDVES